MEVCYLILAHNNPHHFERLINAIWSHDTTIFVHIDSKCILAEFKKRITHNNVIFIKKRVLVRWGSFSMVQATLNLLYEALAMKKKYHYYCLLSGSDYPLKSPTYIKSYFKEHYGKGFINIVTMPNTSMSKTLGRITKYHMNINSLDILGNLVSDNIACNMVKIVSKLNIQRDYKSIFKDIKPYAGSQWWALTHSAVRYIIKFVTNNPELVRFFKNTYVPDELFFQTIIGNSQFKDKVAGNLTFVDWSGKPSHPAIIDSQHIQNFHKNRGLFTDDIYGKRQLLFARKFLDSSGTLVKDIQKNVW